MSISSSATGLKPGVCTSTTRPTNPYLGQIIYETNTGYLRVWDGANWDYLSQKQDTTQGLPAGDSMGLVYITQATLTGAANGFVNNCFSSAYQNYRILINGVGSDTTSRGAVIQLRKNGTNSATQYYYTTVYCTQTVGPTRVFNANVTSGEIGAFGDIGQQSSTIDIFSPFENVKTTWKDSCNSWATNGGYYAEHYHLHNLVDTYDGFYFAMAAGTFTGKIYVYGCRNA